MATNLSDFFDISARTQMEAAFKTPSHDKFFIFSGPPFYASLAERANIVCPLLFTQAFVVNEQRGGGGQINSLGTTKFIKLPSTTSMNSISINGFSLVTGSPTEVTSIASGSNRNPRWNLLKRLYYSAITYEGGELINHFLYENTKNKNGFKAVGYDIDDIFSNLGASEFYEIPFGLMSICLTKGNDFVVARYYENCTLAQGSPITSAAVNSPVNLTGGIGITFTEEVPLSLDNVTGAGLTTETSSFINTLLSYIGESGASIS